MIGFRGPTTFGLFWGDIGIMEKKNESYYSIGKLRNVDVGCHLGEILKIHSAYLVCV